MTRQEKESLLCSLYDASFHYGVNALRHELSTLSRDVKKSDRARELRDFAYKLMKHIEWCIMDVYKDTNRADTLDAKDMENAIAMMENLGEGDGRSKNAVKRSRDKVLHAIRSMGTNQDGEAGGKAQRIRARTWRLRKMPQELRARRPHALPRVP